MSILIIVLAVITASGLLYLLLRTKAEKTLAEASLVFLVSPDNTVLLARKMRNIGAGCWNGYGGGPEKIDGGDIRKTAIRELQQESGIIGKIEDLEQVAICYFHNLKSNGTTFTVKVYAYILRVWGGYPRETSEMENPTFFPITNLPLLEMMPADRDWVPRILAGETGTVWATYAPQQKELIGTVVFSSGVEW